MWIGNGVRNGICLMGCRQAHNSFWYKKPIPKMRWGVIKKTTHGLRLSPIPIRLLPGGVCWKHRVNQQKDQWALLSPVSFLPLLTRGVLSMVVCETSFSGPKRTKPNPSSLLTSQSQQIQMNFITRSLSPLASPSIRRGPPCRRPSPVTVVA